MKLENVREKCEAHSICVIGKYYHHRVVPFDNFLQLGSCAISVSCTVTHLSYLSIAAARARFFNFYGLPAARLDADQSVYIKEESSKLKFALSWAFNVALFGAPESHMSELRRVWVDRSINTPRWKNFNDNLSSEWSGITIYVRNTTFIDRLLFLLNHVSQL